jgi:hypothetical protein
VTLPPDNSTGIYKNCDAAPASAPSCLTVGGVEDTYGVGEFEITVSQYVTFLNTVDPDGKNLRQLYEDHMNPAVWPKYGSIADSSGAAFGEHYSVAYPAWAQKPFSFGDFRRGAEFVNSLFNGKVLSKTSSTSGGFTYVTYKVRLSPRTEKGMYDMTQETPTRTASTGFVLPSNDEWVKAAYYDPKHGGTDSYWLYPTGPFSQPSVAVLNPPRVTSRTPTSSRWRPTTPTTRTRAWTLRVRRPEPPRTGVPRRPDRTATNSPSISHPGSTSTRTTRAT